jgi:hypothetical protein
MATVRTTTTQSRYSASTVRCKHSFAFRRIRVTIALRISIFDRRFGCRFRARDAFDARRPERCTVYHFTCAFCDLVVYCGQRVFLFDLQDGRQAAAGDQLDDVRALAHTHDDAALAAVVPYSRDFCFLIDHRTINQSLYLSSLPSSLVLASLVDTRYVLDNVGQRWQQQHHQQPKRASQPLDQHDATTTTTTTTTIERMSCVIVRLVSN